jgi:hypothetical protein
MNIETRKLDKKTDNFGLYTEGFKLWNSEKEIEITIYFDEDMEYYITYPHYSFPSYLFSRDENEEDFMGILWNYLKENFDDILNGTILPYNLHTMT